LDGAPYPLYWGGSFISKGSLPGERKGKRDCVELWKNVFLCLAISPVYLPSSHSVNFQVEMVPLWMSHLANGASVYCVKFVRKRIQGKEVRGGKKKREKRKEDVYISESALRSFLFSFDLLCGSAGVAYLVFFSLLMYIMLLSFSAFC
jgi:hypothetical protein